MSIIKLTESGVIEAKERVFLPGGEIVTADNLLDGWRVVDIAEDAVAAPAASLWEAGKWAEADALFVYPPDGHIYKCRQRHPMQSDWTPPLVPALFERVNTAPPVDGVQPWIAGESVAVDDLRSYEGTTYKVLQAHTTQADWTPPATPSLWALVI